jgi:uncharacterized protein
MSLPLLFDLTKTFFTEHKIADDHGWEHAFTVATSAVMAVSSMTECEIPKSLIVAAALLHDTDDRKIFSTQDFSNARKLLAAAEFTESDITGVIEMISLVSASSNGNTLVEPKWKLIPRDADRIEAIGEIGVHRSYVYTLVHGRPIATVATPIVTSLAELENVDCKARYAEYVRSKGQSLSMIDHFYDKLLSIAELGSGNAELQEIANTRYEYMVEWLFLVNTKRCDMALTADLNEKIWD